MAVKRILAPVDGSENSLRALRYAFNLAESCNAAVICIYVHTDMSLFSAVRPIVMGESKWSKEIKKIMSEVRKEAAKHSVTFEEKVIGGRIPGYDITTFANSKTNAIDIIVIAKRGIGFPKEIFLGSTTNFVVNKSTVPVLLVK